MRSVVFLLFVSFACVGGVPAGKWKERRPGKKMNRDAQFEDWKLPEPLVHQTHGKDGVWRSQARNKDRVGEDDKMARVRWCVSNLCEMKKCERMATEFKYIVSPKLKWTCVMAESKEKCMKEIYDGNADIMTAEGEEIYTAGKKFALMSIMYTKEDHSSVPNYKTRFSKYEEEDGSGLKHYTIALVKKTNREVNSYQEMRQRKSCHPGVDMPATFKSPVCALIREGVIPRIGNPYESAGEFFKESCVPGVQLDLFNPNMTNPENLCKLCKDQESSDFCKTVSEQEPYYGFSGALKCLRESQGDVGFFHTHDVMLNYDKLSQEFDIVCKRRRLPLDWDNVVKKDCHITEEYPQVVMVSTDKPEYWVKACTNALLDASQRFSSKDTKNAFSLFDSSLYCPKDNADELGIKNIKYTDLIFKDWSGSLEKTPLKRMTYNTFLDSDTINKWKTCEQLEPKPRAFICVVGDEEMTKCKAMINRFMTIQDVNKISWGCVQASSKHDCVESVDRGVADIVTLNATEMFMAGVDYNLSPFMGENYKDKKPWTDSITVGVMLKDSTDLPEDMHGWKVCSTGVDKINAFLHPLGWLLANGTIARKSTPLRSIGDYFGESCVPGMKTLDIMKHPILKRTLDWETLLKEDVKWEEWIETPLWREWENKENGASDVYEPMYKMQDFESDKFQMLIKNMATEDPRMHKYHTSEVHEVLMKAKTKFSWSNYDGLEDFYGVTMPDWNLISWVWSKPENWEEKDWGRFISWAESRWNQKENWRSYVTKWWADEDWITFKKWMDSEYKDYIKGHRDMHQDTFIRLSLLCSRFQWLAAKWINLQWDNADISHCRERLCKSCAGLGDDKCSMDSFVEEYYGFEGALKCLKQDAGDIAFMDAYKLEEAIAYNSYARDDFVLLCPDGSTVDYTGSESFEECHFGHVPSKALVTCNMHDGVWRWKVAKAFLEAQKTDSVRDALCNGDCESFTPFPFVNQTYQVWLGPMFLRAMEGLLQPPVRRMEGMTEEYGKMYTEDPPRCDDCEEDDDMCLDNCWSEMSPREKGRRLGLDKKKSWGSKYSEMKPDKMSGHQKTPLRKNKMSHNKMDMTKLKKMIMLWKPKGHKTRPIMKWKDLDTMKFGEVIQRMGPTKTKYGMGMMKYGVVPQKYGMESTKMWIKKYIGSKKYDSSPMGLMMDYLMKDTRGKMGHMRISKDMFMEGRRRKMGHMTIFKDIFMKGKFYRDPTTMMMKDNVMEHSMMKTRRIQNPRMETGPMIRSHPSLRGEFYTNVIFVRNGTCNSVVDDLTCFGEPLYFKARAGRIGKTTISVPMCPRPSIIKKTTAQFTCDTGASFMKKVMLPVRCSYVPCTRGFWLPGWSNAKYWGSDNSYPGDYWGSKDWWSFDKRDLNDNWFLADRSKNQIDKSKLVELPEGGQLKWRGQKWPGL